MVFQKGNKLGFKPGNKLGGRPKGSKSWFTIEKEERRKIFDEEVSRMYPNLIRKSKPEYLLDQFIGKATDTLELTTKKTLNINVRILPSEQLHELVKPRELDNPADGPSGVGEEGTGSSGA